MDREQKRKQRVQQRCLKKLDKKEENRLFFERLIQDGTWEQRRRRRAS